MILDENILLNWENFNKEIDLYKKSIDKRVKEIYNEILSLSDKNTKYEVEVIYGKDEYEDYCYDCGGANNPLNDLCAFDDEYVSVKFNSYNNPGTINFIEPNDIIVKLDQQFPRRWLFNDFEQELKDGLQKYKDNLEQKKAKTAATKARSKKDKLKAIETIKSKLSAEELELVSFKNK